MALPPDKQTFKIDKIIQPTPVSKKELWWLPALISLGHNLKLSLQNEKPKLLYLMKAVR